MQVAGLLFDMDANYSLLKRRSRLDPEKSINLQFLRRRLGVLPIRSLYIKANHLTNTGTRTWNLTRTGNRTRTGTSSETWTRTKTGTWPQSGTRTKIRVGIKTDSRTRTRTGAKTGTWAGEWD